MSDRRFWSLVAWLYDWIWDGPVTAALGRVIAHGVGVGSVVLEIGCGTGLIAKYCRERGCAVIGVDWSVAMVRRAARRGRVSLGICSDAQRLPFRDESASHLVLANVLHIHPEPATVLAEAARVLVRGGLLLACVPLDGLTPLAMRRIDRESGRPWCKSLVAHHLSRFVGMLARHTAAGRRRREAGVDDVIEELKRVPGMCLDRTMLVAGCQAVFVMRRVTVEAS